MIELNDLPVEMLEAIFSFLDKPALKAVTEASKKFNEIVNESEKLVSKFSLHYKHPAEHKAFAKVIINSNRNYRKLTISKSREKDQEPFVANRQTAAMFEKLGGTVKNLTLNWINSHRLGRDNPAALAIELLTRRRANVFNFNEPRFMQANQHQEAANIIANIRADEEDFNNIIRHFRNVRALILLNLNLDAEAPAPVFNFPFLEELNMFHCDSNCFRVLSTCTQIIKLDIRDPVLRGDSFETFLVSQTALKSLSLRNIQYPRLFVTDNTASIRFKLDSLVLQNVNFADRNVANQFIQSQDKLKSIELKIQNERNINLDSQRFYNPLLQSITVCPLLHTLNITKMRYKFESYDFLDFIRNPNVKTLIFRVSHEDSSSELFKVLIRMFPNLETVHFTADETEDTDSGICFEEGTVLERVTNLSVRNSSVRSLLGVTAPALQNFSYVPGKTGEFIDDLFGGFFHRHKNITKTSIGTCCGRSYFFVSFNLCQLMVNFLTNLEAVSIYNFNEVNKSVKLLCSLPKLKTLTLAVEDHQRITAKTKVECARSNLKLIPKPVHDCKAGLQAVLPNDFFE